MHPRNTILSSHRQLLGLPPTSQTVGSSGGGRAEKGPMAASQSYYIHGG